MSTATAPRIALDQAELFKTVNWRPHRGQWPILVDEHRFVVAVCGRRFGKSEIGGHKLLPEAFYTLSLKNELAERRHRREFWIVGPTYSDSEKEFRVLYNQLTKLQVPFDRPGTYNDAIGGNMHISLWGGAFQVHAKSAGHPETLVGEAVSGVVMAEAAKIKERVWIKSIRPTLNDFQGWALFSTTPEGKNWIYDSWQRGQDPNQKAWSSYRRPSWMNPFVYPLGATDQGIRALREMINDRKLVDDDTARAYGVDPEIAQLMLDMTEPSFNQEIGADFTEYVGRVFQDFDEEVHVGDLRYNREWQTFAAVDYGFSNPNVWLLIQVDPFDQQINVLGEVYERELGPDDFAREILRRKLCPPSVEAFYPDPASPGDTNVLKRILRVKPRAHTGGALRPRLDAIRAALKPVLPHDPSSRPRIMFDRSCVNAIREFNDYRYPDSKSQQDINAPENPMKKDDHTPEALGRFFAGHFKTNESERSRIHTTRATMRRR